MPIYDVDSVGNTITVGQNPFTDRIEFKGNFEGTGKDATLAIKSFTTQDEGEFICEVKGGTIFSREVILKAKGSI